MQIGFPFVPRPLRQLPFDALGQWWTVVIMYVFGEIVGCVSGIGESYMQVLILFGSSRQDNRSIRQSFYPKARRTSHTGQHGGKTLAIPLEERPFVVEQQEKTGRIRVLLRMMADGEYSLSWSMKHMVGTENKGERQTRFWSRDSEWHCAIYDDVRIWQHKIDKQRML